MRVDHCEQYRAPNADMTKVDELTAAIRNEGCAPSAPIVIKTEVKTEVKNEITEEKQVVVLSDQFDKNTHWNLCHCVIANFDWLESCSSSRAPSETIPTYIRTYLPIYGIKQ